MMTGKITKTEWLLLGLTGLFLCALMSLAAWDRRQLEQGAVETGAEVPQEAFMPDVSPVNVNAAAAEELETLPGIGPELARRIVEYREANGPFQRPEGLLEVAGIGEAKLAALEGRITVDGEQTE